MTENPECTIIIPAYNEEEGIRSVINGLKSMPDKYEILVVDDGSTDNTFKIASETGVRVIRQPYNKGYGAALKTGIRNAKSNLVLFMDADGQHQTSDIKEIMRYTGNYDMVVGARTKRTKISFLRKPGKKILAIIANYLAGMKIPDLNSGFRVIKKDVVMEFMHILPNSFSFTTTITLGCIMAGYSIKYVPINMLERVGTSKINPFRDGSRFILLMIRTIMLFNPLKIFLPISVIIFLLGISDLTYELIYYFNVSSLSILLFLSSLIVFFIGIMADQISMMRRSAK